MLDNLGATDKNIILKHISSKSMSHAYLFYGASEETLSKVALEFVKTIYCTHSKFYCDDCSECLKVNTDSNVDLHHIYKDGNTLGIKQIRELRYKSTISGSQYQYNIFVIHEADKMTVEAENAFLKTLEEPVENIIFVILARSKNVLIDTIISRCLPIKVTEIKEVEELEEQEQIYIMETLLQQFSGNRLNAVEESKKLSKDRNKVDFYMVFMMKFIADVLIYKESNLDLSFNKKDGIYKDYVMKLNGVASSKSLNAIMEKMLYVNEALKYKANPSMGLMSLFICIEEEI